MAGPIPFIDMRHAHSSLTRQLHVLQDSICVAAYMHGFMVNQNHGMPEMLIENILHRSRQFHEWELEDKRDLPNYTSPVIGPRLNPSWMDSLELQLGPVMRGIPSIFGIDGVIDDWDRETMRVGKWVMEFLCDGLGIHVHNYFRSGVEN
eukprot:TRINITY_DN18252_c0_g1_i9.p1 TRINITY_DN18252_c0_g1~~TRINITY_DN18252_c0_g1_i9.p1  ORF type:complete len:149 (+),score=17.19 TRINITY_DN18252_c0_g1_i9:340-786(+)